VPREAKVAQCPIRRNTKLCHCGAAYPTIAVWDAFIIKTKRAATGLSAKHIGSDTRRHSRCRHELPFGSQPLADRNERKPWRGVDIERQAVRPAFVVLRHCRFWHTRRSARLGFKLRLGARLERANLWNQCRPLIATALPALRLTLTSQKLERWS
jgi:hypothetical protein